MRTIYLLSKMLEEDPEYMKKVQNLTLNESKPYLGLKGTFGLFGSEEWWKNIEANIIPQREIKGTIIKVYRSGQDNTEKFNTINILTDEEKIHTEGMYANKKPDKTLYKQGAKINIKYAYEPMKNQPTSEIQNNAEIVLEVSIFE